jgi:hypothetical protein
MVILGEAVASKISLRWRTWREAGISWLSPMLTRSIMRRLRLVLNVLAFLVVSSGEQHAFKSGGLSSTSDWDPVTAYTSLLLFKQFHREFQSHVREREKMDFTLLGLTAGAFMVLLLGYARMIAIWVTIG